MEEISVIYKKFNIRMRVIQSHLRDFVIEMNEDNTKVYDKSFCKALQTLINKWNNIENATIDYFYDMKTLHNEITLFMNDNDKWNRYLLENEKLHLELMAFNKLSYIQKRKQTR